MAESSGGTNTMELSIGIIGLVHQMNQTRDACFGLVDSWRTWSTKRSRHSSEYYGVHQDVRDFISLSSNVMSTISHRENEQIPQQSNREPNIAIVGFAGRYPDAANHELFWKLLRKGLDVHQSVPPDAWSAKPQSDLLVTRTDRLTARKDMASSPSWVRPSWSTTERSWWQPRHDQKEQFSFYLPRILELLHFHSLREADSARHFSVQTFHHKIHNTKKMEKTITLEFDSVNDSADNMKPEKGTDLSVLCFQIRHRARIRAAQWHTNSS